MQFIGYGINAKSTFTIFGALLLVIAHIWVSAIRAYRSAALSASEIVECQNAAAIRSKKMPAGTSLGGFSFGLD